MHNYRELKIWQRSMDLAEVVYLKTTEFPKEETDGIKLQIRKSAVQFLVTFLKEPSRHRSPIQVFLEVAMGSCNEYILLRRNYREDSDICQLMKHILFLMRLSKFIG
jgi:four helix bundle protein